VRVVLLDQTAPLWALVQEGIAMTIFRRTARVFGALAVIFAASLLAPPARAASEAVLYSFKGTPDGANPQGTLLKVGDTLYGTTMAGGTYNKGTVFSIPPGGGGRRCSGVSATARTA